jgi:hypothetical protein
MNRDSSVIVNRRAAVVIGLIVMGAMLSGIAAHAGDNNGVTGYKFKVDDQGGGGIAPYGDGSAQPGRQTDVGDPVHLTPTPVLRQIEVDWWQFWEIVGSWMLVR